MTKQQLALILGSSALVTLHLQGCSDDDDDKKSNDCGFTFTEPTDITGIGDNTDYPDCATCAAGKLGGSGLNGNGYCANASEAELAPYSNCDTNDDGGFTNGFPIVNTIDFADTATWPNNLNGVVQALSDCGAKFGDPLLAALPTLPSCIGVPTGTTLDDAAAAVAGLSNDDGCGLCIISQLAANGCANAGGEGTKDCGIPDGGVVFADPPAADLSGGSWPNLDELKKAFSGSSPADPSNGYPGCGGTWEVPGV